MNPSCVLLNGDYTFLCLVDWKKAMCLVFADKVRVLRYSDIIIQGVGKVFKAPAVLLLIKVVRSIYRSRVPFSKKNVLIRDRYTCAYCGKKEKSLTIDHVIPRARGGKAEFENCVACCKDCNNQKGARSLKEAGMYLIRRPFQPTIAEFIRIRLKQTGAYSFLVELGVYN